MQFELESPTEAQPNPSLWGGGRARLGQAPADAPLHLDEFVPGHPSMDDVSRETLRRRVIPRAPTRGGVALALA